MVLNPHDSAGLAAQIKRQRKYGWDLETDIDWSRGVDPKLSLLPLDHDCLAFPGASPEQRLALSQYLGLVINATIGEMERVIDNLRHTAWAARLRDYPVNPEMWELGDMFFEEEVKHAKSFVRYNSAFCQGAGLDEELVHRLMPKAFGSSFLRAVVKNADAGGFAFWWSVASVEEVSLVLYKQLHPRREQIDTLFYQVHRRHMEDEARHQNYAFLMLDLITHRRPSLRAFFQRKTDLLLAQFYSTTWIVSELHKIFDVKQFRHKHPFFDVLASTLPLFDKLSVKEVVKKLLLSAPYISQMVNTKNHPLTTQTALRQRALSLPFPDPEPLPVYA